MPQSSLVLSLTILLKESLVTQFGILYGDVMREVVRCSVVIREVKRCKVVSDAAIDDSVVGEKIVSCAEFFGTVVGGLIV